VIATAPSRQATVVGSGIKDGGAATVGAVVKTSNATVILATFTTVSRLPSRMRVYDPARRGRLAMSLRTGPSIANHARVTKRNSTIDDVAKAAGVARVTVSRVLNNEQNVRPETRERVQRAVEALGYSVNQQARALASGVGRQIMLIHAHNPEREPNSYYHAGLELGALRACSSLGFDLVTRAIDPDGESPAQLIASILEHERPLGIIISPPMADDLELIASARRAGVRMVAISAGDEARAIVSAVGIDERQAGRAIGEHLVALGHTRIGFIKGPLEHRSAAQRYDGFLDVLRSAGLDDEPWTTTGDFTFKSGVEGAEQLPVLSLPITMHWMFLFIYASPMNFI